ncbi:LOW QUALITY PROTEIN: plant-specific TFIIB-related protein PTF2-like [Lycium barbarum]|uniref:LOW QUALITY PROTEIN: plant-specific TFIIB-related protein PTF2-like n=1 Tax=Lycium barbarum TaxID=112863 RepID=UPI00293F78B0|nr:LOW QUALITY PROTEIN: plant-specific TFIIB-related protein PTF2-like [Lycium barbarum]
MDNPNSRPCQNCNKRTIVADDHTGNPVCRSCGIIQTFDNYDPQIGGLTGPTGTYVHTGTSGIGNKYNYKETKIYEAKRIINDITFQLQFSPSKCSEVEVMVKKITVGEYGKGKWFEIFVGACCYVVFRQDNKPLSIVKVASLVRCDIYELGRMVYRVVEFLELELPQIDVVGSFEYYVKDVECFSEVDEDVITRMLKQGFFLVNCLVKWYVTTGRRPLPVVGSVLVFVAELNGVDVRIEDVADELGVEVVTCKLRYKELLERLVKVARGLPWGEDVTVKNIMKHATFVIQYMELKSMSKLKNSGDGKRKSFEDVGFDLDYLIDDCLSNENDYAIDFNDGENDSRYFRTERASNLSSESPNRFQISLECLAMVYSKIKNDMYVNESTISRDNSIPRRKRRYGIISVTDWWKGESEMSKMLLMKELVEKDVGLSAMPPSFDRGCLTYERRKEKIKAAKFRIHKTMYPSDAGSMDKVDVGPVEHVNAGKKRRRKTKVDVDWEDVIIETLLLHQVKEEEIEKGYYKALLDLHVFNY